MEVDVSKKASEKTINQMISDWNKRGYQVVDVFEKVGHPEWITYRLQKVKGG
jgi:hypothetical protein